MPSAPTATGWLPWIIRGGAVEIWEQQTGTLVRTLRGAGDLINRIAFSRDGRRLVADAGNKILLWDTANGQLLRSYPGHQSYIEGIAFWPDEGCIASWDKETIRFWDANMEQESMTFSGSQLVLSPDGLHAAATELWQFHKTPGGNLIRLLDQGTGLERHTIRGRQSNRILCSIPQDVGSQ